ncbi:hypothetical protein NC653_006019 [Populus alba x Populus x berolinensis]|uniref:Uncharacterized protein n=1 Tax=Populus alba x Populus x berolinensis TaxID=444605 RepID=A0AAD6REB3_9ROSI|nr:hypothetical protein NC653_006019 [Populus alba x Populus x berolinensis]
MGYRQVVGENASREDTRAIMSAMNSSHLCQALSEDAVIVLLLRILSQGRQPQGMLKSGLLWVLLSLH